jgi:hypothetical protein
MQNTGPRDGDHDRTERRIAIAAGWVLGLLVVASLFQGLIESGHSGLGVAGLLSEKNGVLVVRNGWKSPIRTYHGQIRATEATDPEIQAYLPLLERELSLYPSGFLARSGLKQIILCRGLSFEGMTIGGTADLEHDAVYLDVGHGPALLNGGHDPALSRYLRLAIHHELFHYFDFKDDRLIYSDEAWSRLNEPSFEYGLGGRSMQGDPKAGEPADIPGFLTRYATSGVEEDKAEMFAHMMVEYGIVDWKTRDDRVLSDKMTQIERIMKKFRSDANELFWDRVRNRR